MIKAIVMGASFGGMEAVKQIITGLPPGFNIPVAVVLHIGNNSINTYMALLQNQSHYTVKEAEEKEPLVEKTVYFAPPNYHLLIEEDFTFSLSTDEKINFSRPAIDVLFETAAWSVKSNLLGVLLTGSNSDGAAGLNTIKQNGGITIVENPETAFAKTMPETAVKLFQPDYVLSLEEIAGKIAEISIEE
jgi:two-component system chemotaxis response regulator CheB